MNIFGWKSTGRGLLRPNQTHAPKARVQQDRLSGIRTYGQAGLGEWPRNYEAQMREGIFPMRLRSGPCAWSPRGWRLRR
jgi:hypothetical protein